jgi:hypothetical protein
MTPDCYQQVAHIYHQAVELEPDKRAEFPDRVCAGDSELRSQVELLLVSDKQAEGLLEQPAIKVAARQLAS